MRPLPWILRPALIASLLASAVTAAAQTAALPAPPPPASDWVAVTLASDDPRAGLYAKDARKVGVGDEVADGWSFVCLAPCGERVDPGRAYRVMGEALVPSVEFRVAPGSGSVAIQVHARHPASSAVTATLLTTASVGAVGGALLLLLDVAEHGAADALVTASAGSKKKLLGHADTYGAIGGGMLIGAAVLGTAALIYVLTVGKTELAPAGATTQREHPKEGGIHPIPFGFAF